MNQREYINNCYRTWNKEISIPSQIDHALLGIGDEIGEMHSAVKKVIGYGQEFNEVNFKEEVGDLMYFMFILSDLVNVELPEYVELPGEESEFCLTNFHKHFSSLKRKSALLDVSPPFSMEIPLKELQETLYDIIDAMGWSPKEVAEANINKLRVRFPDKFNQERSIEKNRNRDEEAKALINER